jgi:YebC/PmpR family DNA-binding regulatory protein
MSGHSKWSTIKRQKGVADVKRGQQFSKLSRAISIAAKDGGPDPNGNPRLRLAIETARSASMPKDNIHRAIERATAAGADTIEELMYEAYAPGGAALLVQVLTDNRNRTLPEIRSIFNKHGGNLGESGSVSWMFKPVGVIMLEPKSTVSADDLTMAAIEAGAMDIEEQDGQFLITTHPDEVTSVVQALEVYGAIQADVHLEAAAEIDMDPETQAKVSTLIELLEDQDDVSHVWTNAALR